MYSSRHDRDVLATQVIPATDHLWIELNDGRSFRVLFQAIPSLAAASSEQRRSFQITGKGYGIHWPDLDEDLSIAGLFRDFGEGKPQLLHEVPHLIADLYRITQRLGEMFDGRPFTLDGHLVKGIGEVVAELVYDLDLALPSTPHSEAYTRDGRQSVQILLIGERGPHFSFGWSNPKEQRCAELLICLTLGDEGFDEIYAGAFPSDLLRNCTESPNGQIVVPVEKLRWQNPSSLPQRYSLAHLNELFRSDLKRTSRLFATSSTKVPGRFPSQLVG